VVKGEFVIKTSPTFFTEWLSTLVDNRAEVWRGGKYGELDASYRLGPVEFYSRTFYAPDLDRIIKTEVKLSHNDAIIGLGFTFAFSQLDSQRTRVYYEYSQGSAAADFYEPLFEAIKENWPDIGPGPGHYDNVETSLVSNDKETEEESAVDSGNQHGGKTKKPGRPHLSEDIEAYQKIHRDGKDPKEVYNWWIETCDKNKRHLAEPKRHFSRIKNKNWLSD
jgi:hypothetical protein